MKKLKKRRTVSEDDGVLFGMISNQRKQRALSLDDLHASKDYIIKRIIFMLNERFPDYDFGISKPTQYILHSLQTCVRTINNYLAECTVGNPQFLERMWNAINEAIDVNHCEIFAYTPTDIGDGPFADGLWTFNYFFYNEEAKRVCFFFCKAEINALNESADRYEEDEYDEARSDEASAYDMDVSDGSDSA
jgi:hypothetical protein